MRFDFNELREFHSDGQSNGLPFVSILAKAATYSHSGNAKESICVAIIAQRYRSMCYVPIPESGIGRQARA